MASSEILLIALGSGFLALCGPKCDLLAIAGAVLLAGFLGRVQALIAASAFSLVVLGVIATGHRFPQEFTRNGQFAAAISAIWCCAIFALSSKSNRGSDRSSNNPFEIRLDELTNYVWSRHADGTVEYVSPDGCEYLGVVPRDIQDFAHYIHPENAFALRPDKTRFFLQLLGSASELFLRPLPVLDINTRSMPFENSSISGAQREFMWSIQGYSPSARRTRAASSKRSPVASDSRHFCTKISISSG